MEIHPVSRLEEFTGVLNSPAIFVTGTDTDAGKTVVSAEILRCWRAAGERVCGVKPFASGCEPTDSGWTGGDAPALHAASGSGADEILSACGAVPGEALQSFRAALGPVSAARAAGRVVDLESVDERLRDIAAMCAEQNVKLLTEGVGGPLVPLGGGVTVADWMARLDWPAVIVTRSRLGTISQTLMAVECLRRRKIPIAGIILSRQQAGTLQTDEVASFEEIREALPEVRVVLFEFVEKHNTR